jgi:hypothetical protein
LHIGPFVASPIAFAALITAYSKFAFIAPHLLGAILNASGLLVLSGQLGSRAESRSRPDQSHEAVSAIEQ